MGADEQEDDSGGSEVLEDVLLPFGSWDEIAVIPVANDVLVSQIAQVDGQFIAEFAIFVRVGDKNVEGHALLCALSGTLASIEPYLCHKLSVNCSAL